MKKKVNQKKMLKLLLNFFFHKKNVLIIGLKNVFWKNKFNIFFVLEGLHPLGPDAFEFNSPSQLVIGYHWLAFLDQVRKIFANFLRIWSTKLTISKKLKIDKILFSQVLEHCTYFVTKTIWPFLVIFWSSFYEF